MKQSSWNVLSQVATEEEKKDEKVLLGNIYNDKVAEYFHKVNSQLNPIIVLTSVKSGFGQEFLREVYEKCEDSKELQEKSEEGFLFLTDRSNNSQNFSKSFFFGSRSEVWRTQKPVYVTKGEKVARVEGIDVNFRARSKSLFPESFKKRFECGNLGLSS